MKIDVEMDLPPKKEYVLYCPLSVRQREAYDKVLDGGLRNWLIKGGTTGEAVVKEEDESQESDKDDQEVVNSRRSSRRLARMGRKSYAVDGDDDEYFDMVESGEVDERGIIVVRSKEEAAEEQARLAKEHQYRTKGQSDSSFALKPL